MTAPISVLIVEDHNLFRTGIRVGCQRDASILISGEAIIGQDALTKADLLSPDVILMDIGMPVMDGFESTRLIKGKLAKTKVIMLTSQDSEDVVHSAFSSGASGFCLKDIDSTLLCSAIKAVHSGETWLDPSLSKKAMKMWSQCTGDVSYKSSPYDPMDSPQALTKTITVTLPETAGNNCVSNASMLSKQLQSIDSRSFNEKYECLGLLGKGGMSEVYKARHKLLDKFVAVKFLASQICSLQPFATRFAQEARISGKLSHPNIAGVNDFGFTAEGNGYLVMEYAKGPTLAELLVKSGRLNERECRAIFKQLQNALSYSHSKNIIHRDVKPANVILETNESGEYVVKLVDFGLAKLTTENSPSITLNGQILGSPIYMSPEQCQGLELDQRSDIYSLGCLMYEVIAGYPPFRGATPLDTFRMHVQDDVPALSEHFCSENMRKIIQKCLQKRPCDRYSCMSEFEL